MEDFNLLLSDTDFIEAWENFLRYYNQTNQLLALSNNSTNHDNILLYAEAIKARTNTIEAYTRINYLALKWIDATKPHLYTLLLNTNLT